MRPISFALLLAAGGLTLFGQQPLLDSIQVLGGGGLDFVVSVTPDDSGNVFVLGSTQSADFPATASFGKSTTPPSGNRDTFVAKIRLADWSLAWSVVLRPSVPLALAIDPSGAVYVSGYTDSPQNFPTTPGAFATTATGPWGALFVVKLDPTGSRIVYSSLLAPYQLYTGAPIGVDGLGQVYVAASGSGPVTAGALIPAITVGNVGGYVAKLSADGSKVLLGTYLASSSTVAPMAITVDSEQNIFVAGRDSSYLSNFPSTPGVVQPNHAGGDDAFVIKLRADGTKLEFATLLGGAGGDSANFLQIASDGTIYLAGYCEYGTGSSASAPFPTTVNAGFRTFKLFSGFVARLSPDASALLFSTYVSNVGSAGVEGFSVSGGQIYAAYPTTAAQELLGLNYYPAAQVASTAIQAFDSNSGAVTSPALQIPALTSDGFAIFGTNLVVASNGSQINLPVPSTIAPLGPVNLDPSQTGAAHSHITFGKFLLDGTPGQEIDTDRGYLYFESYPGSIRQQTLNVTSSASAVPYHIFQPLPAPYIITPQDGFTPAAISVSPVSPDPSGAAALLLVSPHSSPSMRILPALTSTLQVLSTAQANVLTLPAAGGPGTTTIRLAASATSVITNAAIPLSVPFQFDARTMPSILTIDRLQGTTPATVNVSGRLDSLPPGGYDVERVNVTIGGRNTTVTVILSRPGPAPLVSPTSLQLSGYLGQRLATAHLIVNPPDNITGFQVLSVPPGLVVSPSSGTGSATLAVTADLTRFSLGATSLTFTIQVGATQVPVGAKVSVAKNGIYVYQPANLAPGLRVTISAVGTVANPPTTGSWANLSPAPADWNGYSFRYRSHTLPILSADPSTLQFDVQFPYDLDLTAQHQPVTFVAPDGTVVSSFATYGGETATAIASFDAGSGRNTVLKEDGTVVSATNPVRTGDIIRLSIVGAGVTKPPIAAGLLPEPNTTVSPTAAIVVAIGGKVANIQRQVLDPSLIGVSDLYVKVPSLAAGVEMMGIESGAIRLDLIPIWIGQPSTQASQSITFEALTDKTLDAPPFTVKATASSGLAVTFDSQTASVCTVAGTTVSLVSAGVCTIRATQSGNANYMAAPPIDRSFAVISRGPGRRRRR